MVMPKMLLSSLGVVIFFPPFSLGDESIITEKSENVKFFWIFYFFCKKSIDKKEKSIYNLHRKKRNRQQAAVKKETKQ